ncbi:YggU family protein [Candidatus Woesearchaeota archaeon CG10_big_fil_rev_8_21_14_0_10_37_12]|nr:MAG: YggU family protein [Candidatus Woesearchaeota archaeon CG10_big_fil_rev_8_21_14_0_10_37_12]
MITAKFIKNLNSDRLKIIVKPNAGKTEIISFDETKQAWKVAIAAPAEDNKANIEVIKFFSKLVGKRICIKSGLKSKEKLLEIRKK